MSLTEQRAFVVHQRPLQPIQIPKAPGGGGGHGGAACVPSSTNNSTKIIGSICSITEIFSRGIFFSIYISADSDVKNDLVISKALGAYIVFLKVWQVSLSTDNLG